MVDSYKTVRFLKQQVSVELKIFNILFDEGKIIFMQLIDDLRLEMKSMLLEPDSDVSIGLHTRKNKSFFRKIKFHNVLHLPVRLHSNIDGIARGKISSPWLNGVTWWPKWFVVLESYQEKHGTNNRYENIDFISHVSSD